MEKWKTRREKIIELLKQSKYPMEVDRIAELLDILNKNIIYEDLSHINKSLNNSSFKLYISHPQCQECNFIFTKKKFKMPSKCPKCKKSRIYPARFQIK